MSTTTEYVEAVVRRARTPMAPLDWETDWHDQPLRHKVYRDVHRLPLPAGLTPVTASLGSALGSPDPGGVSTLEGLAEMLRHSYGLLERRLRVTGNDDNDRRYWAQNATWARATASGGGLYPLEIYWVTGGDGPVQPGVYHYSSPHHAMQRLLAGDVVDRVRLAVPHLTGTDQYLLVSVKFWKNSFKYNSFSYHVVTMDLGALLATWQLWGRATGLDLTPALWFDDAAVNDLLGLDGVGESVLAIVPLPVSPPSGRPDPGPSMATTATIHKTEWERSRRVVGFPQVEAVHRSTSRSGPVPTTAALAGAAAPAPRVADEALPAPDFDRLDESLGDVLRRRRSCFGGFLAQPALSSPDLSLLLAAAARSARLGSDIRPGGEPALTRLVVYVNHVRGLAEGVYDYDPDTGGLGVIVAEPIGQRLQRNYFLDNYNLEQAAAVIAVMARPPVAIAHLGERGYRAVNAEVGAITQGVYLTATGLGLGCGAALGFDNVSLAELADTLDAGEWPLIILMVGPERDETANVDYRLG